MTLAICLPAPLFAGEVVDSVCAIVDKEIILESEVSYGVSTVLIEQGIKSPTPEQLAAARARVLQAYVTQKILLAKAVEDTLKVEDRVVDRELNDRFNQIVQRAGSEAKLVEYFNRPVKQIQHEMRKSVRDGILTDMEKQQHSRIAQVRRPEVLNFYEAHKSELPTKPEKVTLSHILLPISPSPTAKEAALARITQALDQLKEGADFDSVAARMSDDASARNGGRLGTTSRGDLVPEFEEPAYALQPGEISGVVESRYGLHIIKLLDRQGEKIRTQHILIKLQPSDEDKQRVFALADSLRTLVLNGQDFGLLAAQFSTDGGSKDKQGKLEDLPVENLPADFQSAIKAVHEGEMPPPFESIYGIHIIRLDKHEPPRPISPDTDWAAIEQMAAMQLREGVFKKWLLDQIRKHYIWPEGLGEEVISGLSQ